MPRFPRSAVGSALFLSIAMLSSASAAAQAQKPNPLPKQTAPVPLTPAPPRTPEVLPDGSVTFRLVMPHAAKVELHLEGMAEPLPMKKAHDGSWTITVSKLAPQYYSYNFRVDGTDVLDPHNTTLKPSFFGTDNVFLVPGQPAMPWEPTNVPHGVVNHHYYHSNIVGIDSEYYVYTPPNFNPKSTQAYPVLYLLHGYSDDPSAWTSMGKANVILDNLIAQGKAKPMIVVMPLGYGTMEMIHRGWIAWDDHVLVRRNFTEFVDVLFREVMPLVNQEYPLSDKAEDHAVAGLSMGGSETLLVGLNHSDDFAYVGAFSSGGLGSSGYESYFPEITSQTASALNAHLRVLWISCGTEDGLFAPNQKFIAWLKEKGVHPTWVELPGMHAWMVWRDNLSHFLPLLFQPRS